MRHSKLDDEARRKLSDLQDQIEHAWREKNDYMLVSKLSAEHPELSDRLYEFFDLLVSEDDRPEVTEDEMRRAALRATRRLEDEGFSDAAEAIRSLHESATADEASLAPPSPSSGRTTPRQQDPSSSEINYRSFLDYATKKSGKRPNEVGDDLGVTDTFIELLGEYPEVVPPAAQRELANRGAKVLNLSVETSLHLLQSGSSHYEMAASRTAAYESSSPPSYEEIVDYSGLTKEEETFWLSLARGE